MQIDYKDKKVEIKTPDPDKQVEINQTLADGGTPPFTPVFDDDEYAGPGGEGGRDITQAKSGKGSGRGGP